MFGASDLRTSATRGLSWLIPVSVGEWTNSLVVGAANDGHPPVFLVLTHHVVRAIPLQGQPPRAELEKEMQTCAVSRNATSVTRDICLTFELEKEEWTSTRIMSRKH